MELTNVKLRHPTGHTTSYITFQSLTFLIMKFPLAFLSLLGLSSAGTFQRCYPFQSPGQLDVQLQGTTSVLSYPISTAIHDSSIPRYINSAVLEKPGSGLSVCTSKAVFDADQCQGKGIWEFIYNTTKAEAFQSVFLYGAHVKHAFQVAEPGVHCLLFYRDSDSFSDVQINMEQHDQRWKVAFAPNRCHDVVFLVFTVASMLIDLFLGSHMAVDEVRVEIYDPVSDESVIEECEFDEAERTGVSLTRPVMFYIGIILLFRWLMKVFQLIGVDSLSPFAPVYVMNIVTLFSLRGLVTQHTQVARAWSQLRVLSPGGEQFFRSTLSFGIWLYFWVGLVKVWEPLFRPLSPRKFEGCVFAVFDWVCYLGYNFNIIYMYFHFFCFHDMASRKGFSPLRRRFLLLTKIIVAVLPLVFNTTSVIGQWVIQSQKYPQGGFHLEWGPVGKQLFTVGRGNGAFEYDPNPGVLLQLFMYLPMLTQDIILITCFYLWHDLLHARQRLW